MTDNLLDTTVIVDYLRGRSEAVEFLEGKIQRGNRHYISVITCTEIYAGIRTGEEEPTSRLFRRLRTVNIDARIADRAGEYLRSYSKTQNLELADAVIASTVFALGTRLVTLNDKHFPMPDIQVHVPY